MADSLPTPVLPSFDRWVDDRLDRLRGNRVLDRVMYSASALGDDGRGWIALSALLIPFDRDRGRRFARDMAWLTIESIVVNKPIKDLVDRPRPPRARVPPHALRTPKDTSFPSGHAAAAGTMAVLVPRNRWMVPAVWALAGAISVSRVYVGVHHASDVVAGFAIGVAFGIAGRTLGPSAGATRPAR